jgi:hypothetical protein
MHIQGLKIAIKFMTMNILYEQEGFLTESFEFEFDGSWTMTVLSII